MSVDVAAFRLAYRLAVTAVLPFFDRERLAKVGIHNPGWHPDRFDVGAYLRASEDRYAHVLRLYARCGGRPRPRVLEVGGFFGAFPLALARLGLAVTLSEKYAYYYGAFDDLRDFLEGEGIDVWDEDLTEALDPPRPERFDLVTSLALLEHLASTPRPLMDNLRDLLADDGALLIEVPNIAYWPKRLKALLGESVHPLLRDVYDAAIPFTGHHREYTAAELRELIGWSGLEVRELTAYNYTPEPQGRGPALALRRWPARRFEHAREVLLACATKPSAVPAPPLPQENAYGSVKRLEWIRERLDHSRRAVELGCGTGYMLTYPLRTWGFNVVGVDLDEPSIAYGRGVLAQAGIDPEALQVRDLRDLDGPIDTVIASEVLEHLDDTELDAMLDLIHDRLAPDGQLLVTVPNGYGWFELEAALWFRTGFDALARRFPLNRMIGAYRARAVGGYEDAAHPSTVADSPHKQRFTLRRIRRLLEAKGFEVRDVTGSVLFAGPFSNKLFTGMRRVMAWNARLGDRAPAFASGFFLSARRR
jgi:2-polyprenyl-3-methyl-5-hydroxy-6-metoxy-1,4-benzoquinol methylase